MDSKEFAIGLLLINIAIVFISGYRLLTKNDSKTYIVPFISTMFCFSTSCLMLLHILLFNDFSVMRRSFPLQTLVTGISLNTVYIAAWLVGFSLIWRKKKLSHRGKYGNAKNEALDLLVYDRVQCKGIYLFFFLAIISKMYSLITIPYYGWGQSAYSSYSFKGLGIFSLLSGFGSFLPATIVALLLFDGTEKRGFRKLSRFYLWALLIILSSVGLIIKEQRGQFFIPLLYVALGFAFKGERKKFSQVFIISALGVMVLSPVLDSLRRGHEKGTFEKFVEMTLQQYEHTTQADSVLEKVSYGFSKHALGGLTSGILYNVVQEKGSVGLTPYLSIPYAFIPTILLKDKHYPGSSDGTFYTAPNALVGSIMLSMGTTVHVHGGGVSYWQLEWPGVIVNGLLVGMFFAGFLSLTFRRRNLFLWIIFFRMIGYGENLNMSLDWVLYLFAKNLFVLSPMLVFYYVIMKTPIHRRLRNKHDKMYTREA